MASKAFLAQGAKMKAAWKSVKASGLTGLQARNKVRAMLRSGAKPTAAAPKPKRAAAQPKAKASMPRRKATKRRRRVSAHRRGDMIRQSKGRQYAVPWLMDVEGAYRDPAQESSTKAQVSALTLEGLVQSIKTSQVGVPLTLRQAWRVRLALAAGVM